MKQLDWFDFHERGNPNCPACAIPPTPCEYSDGLIHIQFSGDLDELESKCDVGETCACADTQQIHAAVGE